MIKVVNLVSLLAAPLIVQAHASESKLGLYIALVVLGALVVWAIWQSKKDVSPGMG